MAIKGMKQVQQRMQRQLTGVIPQKAERAVTVAASIIGGHATLMTPIDTSVLVNSQYRTITTKKGRVHAAIGYTARYAAAVHEASGRGKGKPRENGNGLYWSPDGEPKFLEKAGDNHKAEIDHAVYEAMKI